MKISRNTPVILSKLSRLSLTALLLAAAATVFSPPRATAHAAYVESSPSFGAVLDDPPTEIALRFSQELFRRDGANSIALDYVQDGVPSERRLSPPLIDNADRHVMSATISNVLDVGRYRVSWTNLSSEDGDADAGWYHFYVGRTPTASEQAEDRAQAQALLIVYPGDESSDEGTAAETGSQTVVNVVRVDDRDGDGNGGGDVGAGPIVWLAAGGLAALMLAASLAASLARQRRAG